MYASSSSLASSTLILASAAPAQAALIGATNAATDSGTSLTLSIPGGALVGDWLIAVITVRGSVAQLTGPAGWTGHTQRTGGGILAIRSFQNHASSADLSSTHTFAFNSGGPVRGAGVLVALRGISATSPLIVEAGLNNASSPSIAIPGLTMTAQPAFLLMGACKATSEAHSTVSGWTFNAAATAASGGVVSSAHRLSVQVRSFESANPPGATVSAGATSAVSTSIQCALAAVGVSITHELSATLGTLSLTGSQVFELPLITASAGAATITGNITELVYSPIWTQLDLFGSNANSYSDVDAVPETTYRYRIVAINDAGESPSNEVIIATPPSQIFTLVADPELYDIEPFDTTGGTERETVVPGMYGCTGVAATLTNPALIWEVVDTVGIIGSYSDFGLDPDTHYAYRVVAVNDNGETISNIDLAITPPESTVVDELSASAGSLTVGINNPLGTVVLMVAVSSSLAAVGVTASMPNALQIVAFDTEYTVTTPDATLTPTLAVTADPVSYSVSGVSAGTIRAFDGQQAVPVADVTDGGWLPSTGTELYATIDDASDDVPVDIDYITTVDPVADEAVVDLSDINTPAVGDVHMLVRTRKV